MMNVHTDIMLTNSKPLLALTLLTLVTSEYIKICQRSTTLRDLKIIIPK